MFLPQLQQVMIELNGRLFEAYKQARRRHRTGAAAGVPS